MVRLRRKLIYSELIRPAHLPGRKKNGSYPSLETPGFPKRDFHCLRGSPGRLQLRTVRAGGRRRPTERRRNILFGPVRGVKRVLAGGCAPGSGKNVFFSVCVPTPPNKNAGQFVPAPSPTRVLPHQNGSAQECFGFCWCPPAPTG